MAGYQLADRVKDRRALIDDALDRRLPPAGDEPRRVHEAMRYAVLGEGKRLRPILTLCVADLADADPGTVLDAACAVEYVHTASLIFDDLPSMDNALQRRDRPCTHIAFDEATAILSATGLIALGFELLVRGPEAKNRREAAAEFSRAIGTRGIIFGQSADLQAVDPFVARSDLESVHVHKSGALFVAAVRLPALLLGLDAPTIGILERFARQTGLGFQISDDLLDTHSPDDGQDSMNFALRLGVDEARRRLDELIEEACRALDELGPAAEGLRGLAEYIRMRVD